MRTRTTKPVLILALFAGLVLAGCGSDDDMDADRTGAALSASTSATVIGDVTAPATPAQPSPLPTGAPTVDPCYPTVTTGGIAHFEAGGELGAILVVEHPDDPNSGEQYVASISPETRILSRNASGTEPRTFGDLQTGMRVVVTFCGEIAASYPAYAQASEIVIMRTTTEGSDDPNDLVTMTFNLDLFSGNVPPRAGDAYYVSYVATDGSRGELFFCGGKDLAPKVCGVWTPTYRVQVEVPRGVELRYSVYRIPVAQPDQVELVERGHEIMDMDLTVRSHYRYHADKNPGGFD